MPRNDDDQDPRDALDMMPSPRPDAFGALAPLPQQHQMMAPRQATNLFGTLTTAMPVQVPRNHQKLMSTLGSLCAIFGDKYLWGWEVKAKQKDGSYKKEWIEGGTVDLAYDLAREYGNNSTEVREVESPSHFTFYARFTDLETGVTTERAFRQRKSQNMGAGMGADRAQDMVYQIGQSKAVRNVILKALSSYGEWCIEEAKKNQNKGIKENPQKYLESIDRALVKFDIDIEVVEKSIGRKKADWITRDIAGVFQKMKAVNDGILTADEAFSRDIPQVKGRDADDDADNETGSDAGGEEGRPIKAGDEPSTASSGSGRRQAPKPEDDAPAAKKEAPKETKATPAAEAPKGKAAKKPAALFEQ